MPDGELIALHFLPSYNYIRYYHEIGHSMESLPLIAIAQQKADSVKALLPEMKLPAADSANILSQLNRIISETHHNLGCIGTETNQPEFTLLHFKIFNKMMLQEIDENQQKVDNRVAISWNELGNAYMMSKMWMDGERCFKQCLSIAGQMIDFSPADFSFPYVNLGLAYWLTDRQDQAMDTLLEGLRYREAKFGRDDKQSFM
jgi:hypothetical protein